MTTARPPLSLLIYPCLSFCQRDCCIRPCYHTLRHRSSTARTLCYRRQERDHGPPMVLTRNPSWLLTAIDLFASLKNVAGFSPLSNRCSASGGLCCQRVTVIAAQGVRPFPWRLTADSKRDTVARKRSAEADTVSLFSAFKVANFIAHSSALFAGTRISRRANLSSSQVDGGANEPGLFTLSIDNVCAPVNPT